MTSAGSSRSKRLLHFWLPEDEALALIDLGVALEAHTKRSSLLDKATAHLDEQRAQQNTRWERCDKCDGTGWVED